MEAIKEVNTDKNQSTALKKAIGLNEAIALVIGIVIGSGIFFKASMVFRNAGSPIMGIMAWIAGGIITMASGLTIAEIAAAIPKTGGVFAYIKELYGEKWAFLFGWVQTVIYVPGVCAALAIVFATQATYFVNLSALQQKLLAIFMLLLIMTVNVISTKFGGKVQLVATIAKMIPIVIIIGAGFAKGTVHGMAATPAHTSTIAGFGAAILGTLWAYDGWVNVGNMASELKNPKKDLPRSIILGISFIILVYVLINIAIIKIMPVSSVIGSSKAASDAAVILFGKFGGALVSGGILISIFGALNGYMMTGVRVPFAMAEEKLLPFSGYLGKVNEKFSTPLNSFAFVVVVAALYVFTGSFDTLTNLAIFALWIFFTMTTAGIFVLRSRHKHLDRPYKVPLYPVVPIIGIVGGAYIIFSTLATDTLNAVIGLGITLIGLPIYMYLKKRKTK